MSDDPIDGPAHRGPSEQVRGVTGMARGVGGPWGEMAHVPQRSVPQGSPWAGRLWRTGGFSPKEDSQAGRPGSDKHLRDIGTIAQMRPVAIAEDGSVETMKAETESSGGDEPPGRENGIGQGLFRKTGIREDAI